MEDIDCDTWPDSPECRFFLSLEDDEPPPEFIRPPPPFLCDIAFEKQLSCSNEVPFPFSINADGSPAETTLIVIIVCTAIVGILLLISGVLIWRNRKKLRKYLAYSSRAPVRPSRKDTPSAASTSDSSDGVAYSDNNQYKKKALLAGISPPSGVKFLTDHHAIRYAPNSHPHLSLDGHIYEEIPNNYPATAAFCFNPTATLTGHSAYPRYAVYCDDGSAVMPPPPSSTQAFDQRRSWLDLLHRSPCPDFNFNLYNDGTKITPPCPCPCYYPSLPQSSTRMAMGDDAHSHVMVNPVEREIPDDGTRHNGPYERHIRPAPYNRRYSNRNELLNSRFYPNDLLNPETVQLTQTLLGPSVIRNEFPTMSRHSAAYKEDVPVQTSPRLVSRTMDSMGQQRRRHHRKPHKCTNRQATHPAHFVTVQANHEPQSQFKIVEDSSPL